MKMNGVRQFQLVDLADDAGQPEDERRAALEVWRKALAGPVPDELPLDAGDEGEEPLPPLGQGDDDERGGSGAA